MKRTEGDQDLEESFTYASYERMQENRFLLSGQKTSSTRSVQIGLETETVGLKHGALPRSRCVSVMAACLDFW